MGVHIRMCTRAPLLPRPRDGDEPDQAEREDCGDQRGRALAVFTSLVTLWPSSYSRTLRTTSLATHNTVYVYTCAHRVFLPPRSLARSLCVRALSLGLMLSCRYLFKITVCMSLTLTHSLSFSLSFFLSFSVSFSLSLSLSLSLFLSLSLSLSFSLSQSKETVL